MSYYSVPDSHVRDKVKAVLKLSIYATRNELDHGTSTDTSDLAIKKILLAWKLKSTNWAFIYWLLLN